MARNFLPWPYVILYASRNSYARYLRITKHEYPHKWSHDLISDNQKKNKEIRITSPTYFLYDKYFLRNLIKFDLIFISCSYSGSKCFKTKFSGEGLAYFSRYKLRRGLLVIPQLKYIRIIFSLFFHFIHNIA
jgi:hypothetical protein